jgi:hypothetical protein
MLVGIAGTAKDAGALLHWRSAIDRRIELFQSFRLRVKILEMMMMMNRCSEALTPDDVMMIRCYYWKVESFDQCYSTSLKNTSSVFADTFSIKVETSDTCQKKVERKGSS